MDTARLDDGQEGFEAVAAALIEEYLLTHLLYPIQNPHQVIFILKDNRGGDHDLDRYFGNPGGLNPFWWTTGGNRQVPHGIGHNAGLEHMNILEPQMGNGWVYITGKPISPGQNVMDSSYLDNGSYFWIAASEVKALHELGFNANTTTLASPVRAAGGAAETLIISGWVAADGLSGFLNPGLHQESATPIPVSNTASTTCLRFTVTGGSAPDYCFTPFPGTGVKAYFAVAAPFPAGTTRVALIKANRELASFSSGPAPQVTIQTPQAGRSGKGGAL